MSCCALYLAFSVIAGAAHVHRAADPHDEMRGVHLDHAHIGHATDHGHDTHRGHAPTGPRVEGVQVAHHGGDAIGLDVTPGRLSGLALRTTQATIVTPVTFTAPSFVALRGAESAEPLRGPPGRDAVPARAPPA